MTTFQQLVKDMRTNQEKYFKTRDIEALKLAKDLERQVDRFLEKKQKSRLKKHKTK